MTSAGKQIFFGIALALMFIGLFNFAIYVVYPSPQYQEFCTGERVAPQGQTKCEAQGGKWQDVQATTDYYPVPAKAINGYCDADYSCRMQYEEALKSYNNIIFYIFVIAGFLLAVGGLFITNLTFHILGFGGGVVLAIEGIIRNLSNKVPALIAGVVIFIIISFFIWRKTQEK